MRKYLPYGIVLLGVVIFVYAGIRGSTPLPESNWDPVAFLLGVCGLAAAISGLGFALYGYFNTHHAEKIIDEKLESKLSERLEALDKENLKMQEAMQKLMTAYSFQFSENQHDKELAISLFEQAVETYPKLFNGYTSLAYAYWYSKQDIIKAKEYFHKAIETFPESYACINDMARFSAHIREYTDTYLYLKKLLDMKPDEYKNIESDQEFEGFKKAHKEKFEDLINGAIEKVRIQSRI
ncbi:hypothetical protein [Brevibacillus sp. SAFN-007a]|uniref:hypothetical protein n=1 Tax=Brevibacillus sp. SAFN-007a TaxID=3436862 RepID=UPI003F7D2F4A